MIIASLILSAAIVFSVLYDAHVKKAYNVKPRIALASVSVAGKTEDSESMQMTATLFTDESSSDWQAKLDTLFKIRENRLEYQNQRIIELTRTAQERKEEAEKALAEVGAKVSQIKKA